MKSFKIVIIIMLAIAHIANAQFKANIKLLAKSKAEGVWLRWAPVEPTAWQLGNRYGYKLERLTLLPDGKMLPNSKLTLTKEPVKPYSEEEFNAASNTSDEVGVVQELLYGKSYRSEKFSSTDIQAVLKNHRELENRFGLTLLMSDISQAAAKSAGLFWIDTSAEKGKRYVYRISLAVPDAQYEPVGIIISTTPDDVLPPVKDITATFVDHKVTLSWPTLLHRGVYTAYYIEKSVDGKVFKRITDMPYVNMSENPDSDVSHFVDSLDVNNKTYYYRINGISPFAEKGPYSIIVKGEGKDDLTGLIVISEGKVLPKRNIQIRWEFPAIAEKSVQGFIVSRASKHDGPYIDLTKKPLSKTERTYISETPHNNSYYKVRGINKNGDEVAISFPYLVQIADETPPATPTGVSGEISETGIATLRWKPNNDKDILGYRVFQKNSNYEEYVEATKTILSRPIFVDSVNIRVLNRKIYYSVVAVDKNYNPSDYSTPLKLLRPDKILPAPPVITRTETLKDTIALSWINSISADIAKGELYKINSNKRDTTLLKTWTPATPLTNYNDLATIPGESYRYRIVAYDSSGNTSQTTSREVFFEPGFRNAVTELKDSVDRVDRKITLRWRNDQQSVKCIVYRKTNSEPIKILATLEGNIEMYVDTKISVNNVYVYKVQPVYKGGVRAMMSGEVRVKY